MKYSEGLSSFLSLDELGQAGFSSVGKNVLVSRKASIYNTEKISLGDSVRIDDFCCLSGLIKVGQNTHITPFCLIAGGENGVLIGSFCTFAYRVSVFSQSDDYLGYSMVNSTVPVEFKREKKETVFVRDHVIVGAGSIIMPGVDLAEGTSIGASSLVTRSTDPWGLYYGVPAKFRKQRSRDILKIVENYSTKSRIAGVSNDS